MLQVSERKIERVKRCFLEEGLEVALNGQPPQREYIGKIDGEVEAPFPEDGARIPHEVILDDRL